MTCTVVRSMLPERSLGTLARNEHAGVDRHLAWCAACRKEARDLDAAASSLVYSLAAVGPDPALEDRVVAAVQDAAAGRAPAAHRRGRMVVAATVAAMMAVAGLGFGAVMAGRAARFKEQAITTSHRNADAFSKFRQILQGMEFSDPANSVRMAQLARPADGSGSGVALTLLSPSSHDMAVATVSGLHVEPRRLPLAVTLVGSGVKVMVGDIAKLDSGGAATIAADLDVDLSGFEQVVVRDASGAVLLRGDLAAHPLQSPSPSR